MDKELMIKVNIGDRHYPVRIDRGDTEREEIIRKAANIINETVLQFKNKGYINRDEQDFLAMTALQLAVESVKQENKQDISPALNRIRILDRKMEEILNKE